MSAEKTLGNFAALLEEIGSDFAKSLPAADPKAETPPEGDKPKADEDPDDAGEKDNDKPELAKSFKLTLDDGTEIEAVDGAELVKSLIARVEGNEAVVLKVLGEASKVITAQGEMLKSLQAEIGKLGSEGKGRKAVLTIAEKPGPTAEEMAKSQPGQIGGEEFMAKALAAQTAGRITGIDVAIAETHINAGKRPPEGIVRAVLADAQ